jgi:urea transport system ATP-binding protein
MALPTTPTILYLDDVSVSFDGFRALNKLSLVLERGEMRAIIGPNGAGKTTMMDVVTGKTRPDTGTVVFDGSHDLTKLDESEIAEFGIGRKFQRPTVFESHTVADNVHFALAGPRTTLSALFGERNSIPDERIDEILTRVRLLDQRERTAGELSHGQKQWLEIGMLLA